jgi:GNAT superfamily N-acetyltransferase
VTLEIRPATHDDALEMSRIHFASENAALDEWGAGVHMEGDIEDAAHGFRLPLRHGEHRFVAELDGRVVGWLLVNVGTRELDGIYVAPEHQRRGIGSALMDEADALLAPGSQAWLWVMSGHLSARRFYEAHGWVADPSQKRVITLEGVDLPQVAYTKRFN